MLTCVSLFRRPLQSRWVESFRERLSPQTSRSVSTSPALCSGLTEVWCPTRLTSLSTLGPCRRQSSTRWGVGANVSLDKHQPRYVGVLQIQFSFCLWSSDHWETSWKRETLFWVTIRVPAAAISQTWPSSHRSGFWFFSKTLISPRFCPFLTVVFVLSFNQRCLEKESAGLFSLWPAGGIMLTLGASLQGLCPPTPLPSSKRGRSSSHLSSSPGESSRKKVKHASSSFVC